MIKEAYTRKRSLSRRSAKANGEEGGEKSTAHYGKQHVRKLTMCLDARKEHLGV